MGVPEAEVLEIPAGEGSPPARVPPRIRRRLLRRAREGCGGSGKASTAEEIEAKLREADLRRQVGLCFHLTPFSLTWLGNYF